MDVLNMHALDSQFYQFLSTIAYHSCDDDKELDCSFVLSQVCACSLNNIINAL